MKWENDNRYVRVLGHPEESGTMPIPVYVRKDDLAAIFLDLIREPMQKLVRDWHFTAEETDA